MKKHKCVVWIIIFLFIIASPSFTYFFLGRYVDSENYENRIMASRPVFSLENYETFPEEYETYYNDNIPFRNQLIRFNNSIDFFVFNQPANERVVIGKDGWLFYCYGTEQSLGYWDFTNDQLQKIADNLMNTKRILEGLGIEFVLFIAPNKETIYMDELPDYYEIRNHYTSTDQLVDYLIENTDIRVIYPKQELLNAKRDKADVLLYHKLDTHWNVVGGYIGARILAEELGVKMPSLDEVCLEKTFSSRGDLTDMLNIEIKDGDIDYDISGVSSLNTVNEKFDLDADFIYHTAGADPRKLFVRRDSFSIALAPSLATQFEHSLWIHANDFKQQQIFDYDADIFVLEVVERDEKLLWNFRISYFSSLIENSGNEIKKVIITPAISKKELPYISIYKRRNGTEALEEIQTLKTFHEPVSLDIPNSETGEIYVNIFADELGEKVLEEGIIKY